MKIQFPLIAQDLIGGDIFVADVYSTVVLQMSSHPQDTAEVLYPTVVFDEEGCCEIGGSLPVRRETPVRRAALHNGVYVLGEAPGGG